MAIDPLATAKDYSLVIYNKSEIQSQNQTEADRVNSELGLKIDKQSLGAPSGTASLDVDGKHPPVEIPFASFAESSDKTNDYTVMSPKRTNEQILLYSTYETTIGQPLGVAPLDANGKIDASYLSSDFVSTGTESIIRQVVNTNVETSTTITPADNVLTLSFNLDIVSGSNHSSMSIVVTHFGLPEIQSIIIYKEDAYLNYDASELSMVLSEGQLKLVTLPKLLGDVTFVFSNIKKSTLL